MFRLAAAYPGLHCFYTAALKTWTSASVMAWNRRWSFVCLYVFFFLFFFASRAIKPQLLFKVFRLYFQETPCGSVAHDRTTHCRLLPYFVSIWAPYYRLQSGVEICSVSPECKLSCDVLLPRGSDTNTNSASREKHHTMDPFSVITLSYLSLSLLFFLAKLFDC